MKPISFQILGVGCWGPGFENWPELRSLLSFPDKPENKPSEIDETNEDALKKLSRGPKPEVIPANERRRAPLPVRLAVESSWQATQNAQLDPAHLPCVFVSGIGDTQLTDYMCKALASENKALSPTKFHNSVHNAAAGYWTISTGCMQAANSIAGFQESVSLALMEAIMQCELENRPILLTFYDAPSSEVLKELLKTETPFSASIIIAPANSELEKTSYAASIADGSVDWPSIATSAELEACYETNPASRILPLLAAIAQENVQSVGDICMPISSERHLKISPMAANS